MKGLYINNVVSLHKIVFGSRNCMGIIKTGTALGLQKRLRWLLRPLGFAYSAIMLLRGRFYSSGFLNSYSSRIPCVSVGNIGWGGSGKTPVVGWLLDWAAREGLRAAVLSRGYGGTPPSFPWLVRAGNQAADTGDEPLLLALQHPEAQVWVDPLRVRAVKNLENVSGAGAAAVCPAPDFLVMDDGFQHLALKRGLDLLLFRPEDLGQGWNMAIPAGSWREGRQALKRASAFLCKIAPELLPEVAPKFRDRLSIFKRPLFCFELQPQGLRLLVKVAGMDNGSSDVFADTAPRVFPQEPQQNYKQEQRQDQRPGERPGERQGGRQGQFSSQPSGRLSELSGDLGGQPYVFAAGLAHPEEAARSLADFLGYAAQKHYFYEDHHAFSAQDAKTLAGHGLPVVCTGKDAVKLAGLLDYFDPVPIYILESSPRFAPCLFTGQCFEDWWQANWKKIYQPSKARITAEQGAEVQHGDS